MLRLFKSNRAWGRYFTSVGSFSVCEHRHMVAKLSQYNIHNNVYTYLFTVSLKYIPNFIRTCGKNAKHRRVCRQNAPVESMDGAKDHYQRPLKISLFSPIAFFLWASFLWASFS